MNIFKKINNMYQQVQLKEKSENESGKYFNLFEQDMT